MHICDIPFQNRSFVNVRENIVKFIRRDTRTACADPESFARGDPSLTIFLDNEGERSQLQLKVGNHRPDSETPFKWRFAGVTMMTKYGMLAW